MPSLVWMFCDTEAGAETSAMLYSIADTAKANQLKPYEYMKHILMEMAEMRIDRNNLDEEKIKQLLLMLSSPVHLHFFFGFSL